jgi:hypothetical protein
MASARRWVVAGILMCAGVLAWGWNVGIPGIRTRFGTEASEAQILSPRPTQIQQTRPE